MQFGTHIYNQIAEWDKNQPVMVQGYICKISMAENKVQLKQNYTERKICLNLFGTKKMLLVLEPKRIFFAIKKNYLVQMSISLL